jgi:hypothetical protein
MSHVALSEFQRVIRATHGAANPRLLAYHHVDGFFDGRFWDGDVLEFVYSRGSCYAWEVDGRVATVWRAGEVDSALAAVRAVMSERTGTLDSKPLTKAANFGPRRRWWRLWDGPG